MNRQDILEFLKVNWVILSVVFITFAFCLSVIFDLLPFLRGPAPYPPEWQWPYFYVNTLDKIIVPIIAFLALISLFLNSEKAKSFFSRNTKLLIIVSVFLSILIQISMLHFSRAGIFVVVGRIIDPEINGYYTASLGIRNIYDFLNTYNSEILNFVYHAKAHPPGAILIFYATKLLVIPFETLFAFADNISLSHEKMKLIWNSLQRIDRVNALISPFIIMLISALTIIPTYLSARLFYSETVAKRSIFLLILVPCLIFFVPINDTFLQIFSAFSFYFLLKALINKSFPNFTVSGFVLFLGVFFNLSVLPVGLLFALFSLFYLLKNKMFKLRYAILASISFLTGFLVLPLLLLILTGFNFLKMAEIIMQNVPDIKTRSYSLWIYYNLQDFLIFAGIPVAVIFLILGYKNFKNLFKKAFSKVEILSFSLLLMILILNFSGSVRGETGRLWSPYIPFIVPAVTYFLTLKLNFSKGLFAIFLIMQFIQILIMQEFWVMLW